MAKSNKKNPPVATATLPQTGAPAAKAQPYTFWQFLKQRQSKVDLWIFFGSGLVCFALLRQWYPFPDTYSDSNTYIGNAMQEVIGNYRPVGYSRFLRAIGNISKSPGFLVFSQLALYFLSVAFTYFTVIFFFAPSNKLARRTFLFFILAAPSSIYLVNLVLSDAYFTSLTNLWVATLVWIVMSRNKWMVLLHCILLIFLFQTRYIALFYPAVSFCCFLVSFFRQKLFLLLCLAATTAIFFLFISNTRKKTGEDIGIEIFSGFSGWQTANNALHIVPYCDTSSAGIEDPQIQATNRFIVSHFPASQHPQKGAVIAGYIWDKQGPLKQYMMSRPSASGDYLYEWHAASIELGDWGNYMIKKHPGLFLKHYLLPNFYSIFHSPLEILDTYSEPSDFAKEWFECKNCQTKPRYDVYHQVFSRWAPLALAVLWIAALIAGLAFLFFRKKGKFTARDNKMILVLFAFIFLFVLMSVYASPLVLRYFLCIRIALVAGIYIITNQFISSKHKHIGK